MRLTQYAHGGGCACKIPPGELEHIVAGLTGAELTGTRLNGVGGADGSGQPGMAAELLVGLDTGDDAGVVRLPGTTGTTDVTGPASTTGATDVTGPASTTGATDVTGPASTTGATAEGVGGTAVIATADFFTPVVDDAYDWGRIAAANALSDVYAMGGQPVLAVNLLAWPRESLSLDLAAEVLRGGLDITRQAGCHLVGGHSVDDVEPKYGMAVTGIGDPARLLRNDAGRAGLPLSLTKPLGLGVLNNRHKATGEVFGQAVATMVELNRDAAVAALAAGVRCATDVTGFGLLGHAYKLARASGVTAVIDAAAVPYLDGAVAAVRAGYVSGGTRRNLDWVAPHTDFGTTDEHTRLLLADAQTSGGLLVAGEVPGAPVIGELVPQREHQLVIR